jgi:hypothetical protein
MLLSYFAMCLCPARLATDLSGHVTSFYHLMACYTVKFPFCNQFSRSYRVPPVSACTSSADMKIEGHTSLQGIVLIHTLTYKG